MDVKLSGVLCAQAERNVVDAMTQCQKPDMAGLQQLVTPVGAEIQAADKLTLVGSTPIKEASPERIWSQPPLLQI